MVATYKGRAVRDFLESATEAEKHEYYAKLLAYIRYHFEGLDLVEPVVPVRQFTDDEERN